MIDIVKGTIYEIQEKSIGIIVNGFGLKISTPRGNEWSSGQESTLHTYLHWNSENGPSLFGFSSIFERTIFLLIIECPKIGPSIALNILHQLKPEQFLEIVTSQNEKGLSIVNGIGTKKAEQIIVDLKHKVAKLTSNGTLQIPTEAQDSFMHWQEVNEVLISLNYSKQEIQKALQQLSKKYENEKPSLDKLIRAALGMLSSPKNITHT